ncbi:hypothetical protein [Prevotella sp.]|uniref:hypothetical protein n=1 Tax=Prevotella sp. TaxID=59823 RepID=UPI002649F18F|nr:hypothetical protein [Prevotella sp.]MDN5554366.1 hypothetical protein [Prevotella sp.]
MTATEDTLTLFSTRVRQMILQYKELRKENAELYSMVNEKDKQVEKLKAQITQAQNDYNSLKMAKMLEITDGDMENAQKRLQKLIRDVNKCITLLSEK